MAYRNGQSPSVLRSGQETLDSIRALGRDLVSPQVQRDAALVYQRGSRTVNTLAETIAESARALSAALGEPASAGAPTRSSSSRSAPVFSSMSISSTIATASHSLAVVLVNHPTGYHPEAIEAHCQREGLLHPEAARLPPPPSMPARHVHFYASPGAVSSVWG